MAAIQKIGSNLKFASNELKNNKEIILESVKNCSYACLYSLLEGYQEFDEIIKKEGEEFLFSYCDNWDYNIRLQVAKHPNFLPTEKQIVIGLQDRDSDVRKVYELRKDEWLAKIEENKLRNTI